MLELIVYWLAVLGAVIAWDTLRLSIDRLYDLTDFKPFNCKICMSFWIGFLLSFYLTTNITTAIIYAFSSVSVVYLVVNIAEWFKEDGRAGS